MTTISEGEVRATRHVLHVELVDGKELQASVGEAGTARVLDDMLQQLESATFVRLGDDTLARAADVRCVRIRAHDEDAGPGEGPVDSLKQRLGGGEMSYDTQRGGPAVQQRSEGHGQAGFADQFFGYGNRPFAETKPFFLTSEFLAFLAVTVGVLIASWVTENLDAPRAWLIAAIVASAYIVSRGLAKAGTRDPNPDHRRWQN